MPHFFVYKKTILAGLSAIIFILATFQLKFSLSKVPSNLPMYGAVQHAQDTEVHIHGNVQARGDDAVLHPLQPGYLLGDKEPLSLHHIQMESLVRDLRNFLVSSFHSSLMKSKNAAAIVSKSREFLRVLEIKLDVTKTLDGAQQMVDTSLKALQALVQRTIHTLQHPVDCEKAPKLLCTLDNPWGFAAGMHDVLWCFVAALRMGRTVILESSKWHHAPGSDWSKTFVPIASITCTNVSLAGAVTGYPGYDSSPKERNKILDLPLTVADTLVANHGTPYAWWYGQIMAYILRLQDSTRRKIDMFKRAHDFEHPIVGIHIRRTDKLREAAYHETEQYMSHVVEFYLKLSLTRPLTKRRVFVATDEPMVITQLEERFPKYTFIYDKASAEEAHNETSRSSSSALFAIVRDVYLLAESDFLVCTFSSGFCRVAFELMQTLHSDATSRAVSVDIDYFYAYVPFPPSKALFHNWAHLDSELDFDRGQLIEKPETFSALHEAVGKEFYDGYQQGRILGSTKVGKYPTYKTAQTYRVVEYAAFNTSHR
ncbi:alpha-(1,6)-fucosyltransferase-like [Ornithodoros turicata]|uniref:alpha-(1,6)-fucosyltransferase-like n=1 Tax=Ornithodoros turicata TaxID=34597 RepID=UPI003138C396